METGHPSTRAVNSGSGNRALDEYAYFCLLVGKNVNRFAVICRNITVIFISPLYVMVNKAKDKRTTLQHCAYNKNSDAYY